MDITASSDVLVDDEFQDDGFQELPEPPSMWMGDYKTEGEYWEAHRAWEETTKGEW